MPPSPPRFGAQARLHNLLISLCARHDVTALVLADARFDLEAAERAMRGYSGKAAVVSNPFAAEGSRKRAAQLRSLASLRSYEDLRCGVQAMQEAITAACRRTAFDVVHVEFPYLMRYRFGAPPGVASPPVILDTHNIEYDILRQTASSESGMVRRIYSALNWRKLRVEERAAFRRADGIAACSHDDAQRILADVPGARTAVVPNGADIEYFKRDTAGPASDDQTVMFFGTMGYYPNVDATLFMLREVWPKIVARHPQARLKIVGLKPPPEVLAFEGPRIEVTGFVEDLRPHLASAAVLIAPLRLGGGTRLKILEGMSMSRPVVSTTLGAEGIAATHDVELLIADGADAFAAAVGRILEDSALGERLGAAGRRLVEEKYSWHSASRALECLYRAAIDARGEKSA